DPVIVQMRTRLPADLEYVPETFRYQQTYRHALALDDEIGGDRGTVSDPGEAIRIEAVKQHQLLEPLMDRQRRVVRRGRHLVMLDGIRLGIEKREVRERTPDVEAYVIAHGKSLH